MGLAASQTRYLSLTARKSNVEFQGQQINQQRLELADRMSELSKNYSEGMANRRIYLFDTSTGDSTTRATFQNLTGLDTSNVNYNYRFVDQNGRVVTNSTDTFNGTGINPSDYIVMEDIDNPDIFEQKLRDGDIIMQKVTTEDGGTAKWQNTVWSAETTISDELYDDDDSVVQSDYDYKLSQVQNADKQLEMELKKLESEQKALDNELEAVKKVIENNVKTSFKTFA